jgi:hypothetical protein
MTARSILLLAKIMGKYKTRIGSYNGAISHLQVVLNKNLFNMKIYWFFLQSISFRKPLCLIFKIYKLITFSELCLQDYRPCNNHISTKRHLVKTDWDRHTEFGCCVCFLRYTFNHYSAVQNENLHNEKIVFTISKIKIFSDNPVLFLKTEKSVIFPVLFLHEELFIIIFLAFNKIYKKKSDVVSPRGTFFCIHLFSMTHCCMFLQFLCLIFETEDL